MNNDKSTSSGFRNSGRFSFAGRGGSYAIIAALVLVIVLVLLLVGGQMCGGRGRPLDAPKQFFVKCTECKKEWEIKRSELSNYQNRELRDEQGHQIGGNCPHCKEEGCAYLMIQCPNPDCGEYYLPKRFTDPEGLAAGNVRDVCPHCDTDLVKWHMEHKKKR